MRSRGKIEGEGLCQIVRCLHKPTHATEELASARLMTGRTALLGTWKMVSWGREFVTTGEKLHALGPDPVGYLTYGADGRVHAIVVSKDRAAPAALPPNNDEKLRLFDSMLAYAGTYTLDSEKVVHHVDISWNQA